MAVFKCKMCGAPLEVNGESVVACEYCATQQTLPKLTDENKVRLYDRANHFRRNNEYDKAMGIYEQILTEDTTDAEAYWSLVLCRYGIEYVEDPASKKRVPTVHRAQHTSIYDDSNYKAAIEYADAVQKGVYEAEAKAINEIQKGILAISLKEKPFDVFICYKETDAAGNRTQDSVLANDLYHQLTREGYKVFFSRITLENKLGTAYEPYIFAALNSAKVMIVLGTKPEYFQAVWVKNEWSRYLALIKNGAEKMIIPAYRDMDPYDLPDEFSNLQSQDMSKLGCVQDIIHGIKKIIKKDEPKVTVIESRPVAVANAGVSIESLLERVSMFIDDKNWHEANLYCEKVLDIDPKNGKAYIYKLLAECQVSSMEALKHCTYSFENSNNYQKAIRFCDEITVENLEASVEEKNRYVEELRRSKIYEDAVRQLRSATSVMECAKAQKMFESVIFYSDSEQRVQDCKIKAEEIRKKTEEKSKDEIYNSAKTSMSSNNINGYTKAMHSLKTIPGWKDSDALVQFCEEKIEELNTAKGERKKKGKKVRRGCLLSFLISIVVIVVFVFVGVPAILTAAGDNYVENGKYADAEGFYGFAGLMGNDKAQEMCIETVSLLLEDTINKKEFFRINEVVGKYEDNAMMFSGYSLEEYINGKVDSYMSSGDYYLASILLEYVDLTDPSVSEKLEECQNKMIEKAEIGDNIRIGKIDQYSEREGQEMIDWVVVDKSGDKLMLVSAMAIEYRDFSESNDATWASSDVRQYLNKTFYNEAFSDSEKSYIVSTNVNNTFKGSSNKTVSHKSTTDKIYLPSRAELEKYFAAADERKCYGTKVVVKENTDNWSYKEDSYYCVDYFTRNPGIFVQTDGEIDETFYNVSTSSYVRPVMWIKK